MITNTDLPFHFIVACKIDSHFNTMRLMHSIFLGVLTRINIFSAFTTQFCKNWNFSLKMIALILILVSKTSKSKAKWPEQSSNVSKARKDRWRNQKFQHWKNRKRDLSRNSNQQQQVEDETAFRINEEIKKKCSWRSGNDVWRMVQSMERDESKVYHCGSLIAHIINWQTKQISNVISKAY